jgi:predicted nucleic acid-binding protein
MVVKYLLDTCIWRDFYENRRSRSGKPLGAYASDLFMKILRRNDKIIFSESLLWELKKDYEENDVKDVLNILLISNVLIKVEITKSEYEEAKRLCYERNVPFVDCLNAIHARNHKAVLVSQDAHFFEKLNDIINPVRPEEIT